MQGSVWWPNGSLATKEILLGNLRKYMVNSSYSAHLAQNKTASVWASVEFFRTLVNVLKIFFTALAEANKLYHIYSLRWQN